MKIKMTVVSCALALVMFAAAAFGQEGDDKGFRGMVRLKRAPVSNDVLRVKLPRPVEKKLSNGIQLLILENHREPGITLTIQIPSSALRDPDGLQGVAEATAAMMRQGTTTRTARQITDALSEIGASVNFSAGGGGGGRGGFGGGGGGRGTISVNAMADNIHAALRILHHMLLHPPVP